MVRLREIPRTATFAWSPGSGAPFVATGTKAGAVDADFSSETKLELWNLDLGKADQSSELRPVASFTTDSRFHDIAWVKSSNGVGKGVIAGALEDGTLNLWEADRLLNGESGSLVSKMTKHTGAIKALQFNSFRSDLLATSGAKGELFISDLNNIANPFRLGNTAARADDFDCLDWNKKVPHIMVTGSSGGFVTVWDVKSKKESLTLNNSGRKPVSAVAWDPDKPTRVITAVPLDTDPLILVWDLRNSNTPEKILRGHEGGVLSLSWCSQDNDLLLSCGKDNRTICWSPQTGEAYGEFSVVTNWTFQTEWNPHNPSLFATASFDGKVGIQTIQNTKTSLGQNSQAQPLDGEDFFNKAQTQTQVSSFSLSKAPKWLQRPCSASFGFGGKLVKFGLSQPTSSSPQSSKILLTDFAVDDSIGVMTEKFSEAMKAKNLKETCETQISQAALQSEKTDWRVIETLIAENPRKELVNYLGISHLDDTSTDAHGQSSGREHHDPRSIPNGANASDKNRLSSFFEAGQDSDNFLAELASTKGAKTNNPFSIYSESESDAEKRVTQALLLGNFERAMELCLAEDRLSDAFMIATCGGSTCIEKAQKAYFKKQSSGPRYLRLLASVVGKNLWDIVYNADLQNWREVMASLCTYATAEEFPDLCEALGDRLEDQSKHDSSDHVWKENASFCYIAGSKLEKVVGVWIAKLEHDEEKSLQETPHGSNFAIHARSLQNFIEKVTVFREVTRYLDKDRSASKDWKLAALYEKYVEYADIVSAHGQLRTAELYLNLLPKRYPAADVARNRVKQATRQPAAIPSQRQQIPPTATMASARGPILQETQPPAPQGPGSYTPPVSMQAPRQLAPQNSGPYAPTGSYQPAPTVQAPPRVVAPPPSFGVPNPGNARSTTISHGFPPPSKAANMSNWNDIPEEFSKPTSRRGTPAAQGAVPNSTYPNPTFPLSSAPPIVGPGVIPKTLPAPAPPPPKGPAPPVRTQTPQMGQVYSQQGPDRPPSSAANIYAPPPTFAQSQQQGTPQRGPSPYEPPLATQPGPGRYAPPPPSVVQQIAPQSSASKAPPPPPPNPYATRQNFQSSSQTTTTGPPQGPPRATPSESAQGRPELLQSISRNEAPQPTTTQKPPTPKHPPGDRSHIPPEARPIYDYLNEDMQRVKAQAPASFRNHVIDTEKRLNILFDHLNNENLLKSNTVQEMRELAESIRGKDYEKAMSIHLDLITNRTEECGNWMIGVKRLISMSRATP